MEMIDGFAHSNRISYTGILALRPDTAVIRDIDIGSHIGRMSRQDSSSSSSSGRPTIWIPSFSSWEGLNDRAAYGSVP